VSIKRWAARTDANQADIVSAMRAAGASVWIIGMPVDLLVGAYGKTIPVEVKTMTGKKAPRAKDHTRLQVEFLESWRGGPVATVCDVDSALRLVNMMREP
jgi:Holliday junction resolvase